MKRQLAWLGWLAIVGGCGGEPPAPQKPASVFDYATKEPAPAATAEPAQPPAPKTEQVEATVGVGKKGHGYGGGLITEPVHQYFAAKERIAYEIEVPHALNLYKASHDFKGPKTHESFMKEIIEANQIKLPELPEGARYVYDPKTETLLVERPVDANQNQK